MLARKSKNNRLESSRSSLPQAGGASPCQFYWFRPLGGSESCRRLTVERNTAKTALWALPLSLERLLKKMDENPSHRLEAVELDGTEDAWKALRDKEWKDICQKIRRRNVRKIGFYGGILDIQRSSMLNDMPWIQSVELYESRCHDETLRVVLEKCRTLAELRMFYCADLSRTQADMLLSLLQNRPTLRSLVLLSTPFDNPQKTALRFCLALEDLSSAALDEAEFSPMEDETKEYLSVILKIHRMRHYYYTRRRRTALAAFATADDALAVVQQWWRSTHRPNLEGALDTGKSTLENSLSLSRHASYGSTGSC